MNDDLEQRLAALRPAELPADLQAHLATPPVAREKIRWLWAVAPLAAAACWFLVAPLERPTAPVPKPVPGSQPSDYHVYLPVKKTSTLVQVEDLAVIDPGQLHPIRVVRATWLDGFVYAGDDRPST